MLMATQWNVAMNGRSGLKYEILFLIMDRLGLTGDDWWQMFHDIRHMECEAMAAERESSK